MKISKYIIVMTILSCTNLQAQEKTGYDNNYNNPFIIDVENNLSNFIDFKLSSFIESYTSIPLDLNSSIRSNNLMLLKISKNFILAFGGELCLFDKNGRFITQFGKKERIERLNITDMAIDEEKGLVYALTPWAKKLLVYNLKGLLIDQISGVDFNYDAIEIVNRNKIFIGIGNPHGNEKYGYLILNNIADTLVKRRHSINWGPYIASWYGKQVHYYTFNNTLYAKNQGDTVFYINTDSKFIPMYVLKFFNTITSEFKGFTKENNEYSVQNIPYYHYFFEIKKYFFFAVNYKKEWFNCIYDKELNKMFALNINENIADFFEDPNLECKGLFKYQFNNELVMFTGGKTFLQSLQRKNPIKAIHFQDKIKDNHQAVIIIMKVKP